MTSELPYGATPLDPDEMEGLLHSHVTTRRELDELEETNIQAGVEWARRRTLSGPRRIDVLSEPFVYDLHRRMFEAVRAWAGTVRSTDKNIGVDKLIVRQEVKKLIDGGRYWRDNEIYDHDEIAVRFHHRLVSIHPFPNGNGRHARMMADLLVEQLGRPPFSWGGASLVETSNLRRTYIEALRRADRGDLQPLIIFARA